MRALRDLGGLCGVVSLLALTGCGANSPDRALDAAELTSEPSVLRIATVEPIDADLAPIDARSPMELLVADLTHDTLTDIDQDTGDVVPGLATSWESDDASSWTFTVDVDGPSADDYATALRELADSSDSLAARRLDLLASVTALDNTTIEIETTRPYRDLPALLADVTYGLDVTDADDGVATGPFVDAGRRNDVQRYEVLAGRSGDTDVDAIEFIEVADLAAAAALVAADAADIAPVGDGQIGAAGVLVTTTSAPWHGVLNTRVAPLDELSVRQGVLDVIADDDLAPEADGDISSAMRAISDRSPLRIVAVGGGAAADVADAVVARCSANMIDAIVIDGSADEMSAELRSGKWDVLISTEVGSVAGRSESLFDRFSAGGDLNVSGIDDSTATEALAAHGSAADGGVPGALAGVRDALAAASVVVPVQPRTEQFFVSAAVDGVLPLGEMLLDIGTVRMADAG